MHLTPCTQRSGAYTRLILMLAGRHMHTSPKFAIVGTLSECEHPRKARMTRWRVRMAQEGLCLARTSGKYRLTMIFCAARYAGAGCSAARIPLASFHAVITPLHQ